MKQEESRPTTAYRKRRIKRGRSQNSFISNSNISFEDDNARRRADSPILTSINTQINLISDESFILPQKNYKVVRIFSLSIIN
jgi:hypothetical protein